MSENMGLHTNDEMKRGVYHARFLDLGCTMHMQQYKQDFMR